LGLADIMDGAGLLQFTTFLNMSQIMVCLLKRALFGYLPNMTAGNSLNLMLMPDEVQDTRTHEPVIPSTSQ